MTNVEPTDQALIPAVVSSAAQSPESDSAGDILLQAALSTGIRLDIPSMDILEAMDRDPGGRGPVYPDENADGGFPTSITSNNNNNVSTGLNNDTDVISTTNTMTFPALAHTGLSGRPTSSRIDVASGNDGSCSGSSRPTDDGKGSSCGAVSSTKKRKRSAKKKKAAPVQEALPSPFAGSIVIINDEGQKLYVPVRPVPPTFKYAGQPSSGEPPMSSKGIVQLPPGMQIPPGGVQFTSFASVPLLNLPTAGMGLSGSEGGREPRPVPTYLVPASEELCKRILSSAPGLASGSVTTASIIGNKNVNSGPQPILARPATQSSQASSVSSGPIYTPGTVVLQSLLPSVDTMPALPACPEAAVSVMPAITAAIPSISTVASKKKKKKKNANTDDSSTQAAESCTDSSRADKHDGAVQSCRITDAALLESAASLTKAVSLALAGPSQTTSSVNSTLSLGPPFGSTVQMDGTLSSGGIAPENIIGYVSVSVPAAISRPVTNTNQRSPLAVSTNQVLLQSSSLGDSISMAGPVKTVSPHSLLARPCGITSVPNVTMLSPNPIISYSSGIQRAPTSNSPMVFISRAFPLPPGASLPPGAIALPPGAIPLQPRAVPLPPGTPLLPGAVPLPSGTVSLSSGAVPLPPGTPLPPGAIPLPSGTVSLPSGAVALPPGTRFPLGAVPFPPGAVPLPPGTPLPPGAIPLPSGTVSLPPGAVALPPGTPLPPGAIPLSSGTVSLPPGAVALPPGAIPLPAGAIYDYRSGMVVIPNQPGQVTIPTSAITSVYTSKANFMASSHKELLSLASADVGKNVEILPLLVGQGISSVATSRPAKAQKVSYSKSILSQPRTLAPKSKPTTLSVIENPSKKRSSVSTPPDTPSPLLFANTALKVKKTDGALERAKVYAKMAAKCPGVSKTRRYLYGSMPLTAHPVGSGPHSSLDMRAHHAKTVLMDPHESIVSPPPPLLPVVSAQQNQDGNLNKVSQLEDEEMDFSWVDYLSKLGAAAAPNELFAHVEVSLQNGFKTGMFVEAPLLEHSSRCWVGRVILAHGSLLKLRYEGCDEGGRDDFWVDAQSGCLGVVSPPTGWKRHHMPPASITRRCEDWENFLQSRLSWCLRVPETLLTKDAPYYLFQKIAPGMRMEVHSEGEANCVWICQVVENVGGRLMLRYDGSEGSSHDFWMFFTDPRIHPIEWAKPNGCVYKPPNVITSEGNSYSHWSLILKQAMDGAAKSKIPHAIFQARKVLQKHAFTKGMRLEAINPADHLEIRPATVVGISPYFCILQLDDLRDGPQWVDARFCVTRDTRGIFPPGWCKDHNIRLTPPPGWKKDVFGWSDYLSTVSGRKAPEKVFNSLSEESSFKPGMRLEAVNPANPSSLSVASVKKVVGRVLFIELYSSARLQVCHMEDMDSTNLFPVGWCETNDCVLRYPLIAKAATKTRPSGQKERILYAVGSKEVGSEDEEEDDIEPGEWCTKLFFNKKCFSGQLLSKGKLMCLPESIGPGPMSDILRKGLTLMINAAYKSTRVLRSLHLQGEPAPNMVKQLLVANYAEKTYRTYVETCRTVSQLGDYLVAVAGKLGCCSYLLSTELVETECPKQCHKPRKTGMTSFLAKKHKAPDAGEADSDQSPRKRGRKPKAADPMREPVSAEDSGGDQSSHSAAEDSGGESTVKKKARIKVTTGTSSANLERRIQTRGVQLPPYSLVDRRRYHKRRLANEPSVSKPRAAAPDCGQVTKKIRKIRKIRKTRKAKQSSFTIEHKNGVFIFTKSGLPGSWGSARLAKFLKKTGIPTKPFLKHGIAGAAFLDMTDEELKNNLGLSLGKRLKVALVIAHMNTSVAIARRGVDSSAGQGSSRPFTGSSSSMWDWRHT